MLRLYLLRHAKSSWSDPSLHDFDRPLNKRGQKDAPRMAVAIREKSYLPDRILCSSAQRTRETLGGIATALSGEVSINILDELYEGNAPDYLVLIRAHARDSHNLMVIGHNTGLQEIALRLTGKGDREKILDMETKFPTAALAVLEFNTENWNEIQAGGGELIDFVKPRALDTEPDISIVENPAPTFFRR